MGRGGICPYRAFIVMMAAVGGIVIAYYAFYCNPESAEAEEDARKAEVAQRTMYVTIRTLPVGLL